MSLTQEQAFETLQKVGAILRDTHVIYTSGKHGSAYVNKDAVYPHTQVISLLCWAMAEKFREEDIDVVLAPALGGIILSQWIAHHLTEMTQIEVLGVYAEKAPEGDGFVIRRGYDELIRGKRILIVEDILTTGGSVKKVVEAARAVGANVVGVAALCNRGGIRAADIGDVPRLESLVEVKLEAWDAASCPLCARNVPLNTSVGKARK